MGRWLSDVGKTVSGVLGVRLGEGPDEPPPGAAPPGPQPGPQPEGAAAPAPTPADEEPVIAGPAAPDTTVDAEPEAAAASAVEPDPVLAAAVEIAREAAVEVAGASVGEHLGVQVEGPEGAGPVLTHSFATNDRAYVGWRWAVTVARAVDAAEVTVDEVVLLPGEGALLAPAWVPWSERVQPGDLAGGELLPPPADDPRLVPSYADPEAELAEQVGWELGLARPRVLSVDGRLDAAERWYDGPGGPEAPIARTAPGRCGDCGFLVLLAGSLRQSFGVCANGYAPDDGRVVALTHGCGAHSETVVEAPHAATAGLAVQDDEFEMVPDADRAAPEPAAEEQTAPEPVAGAHAEPTGTAAPEGT